MDELDLLKSKWQNQVQEMPSLSYNDIYKMLLKKSSSIVKWIFYISIAELLLWVLLSFLVPDTGKIVNEKMGIQTTMYIINILFYIVFGVFIYYFYRNYKKIQVTDSTKELMENILKTRKTVKYFVYYNIGGTILTMFFVNVYYYFNKDRLFEVLTTQIDDYKNITPEFFDTSFFAIQAVVGIVFIALFLLFYFLIYGILLGRLKKNYKELERIEL